MLPSLTLYLLQLLGTKMQEHPCEEGEVLQFLERVTEASRSAAQVRTREYCLGQQAVRSERVCIVSDQRVLFGLPYSAKRECVLCLRPRPETTVLLTIQRQERECVYVVYICRTEYTGKVERRRGRDFKKETRIRLTLSCFHLPFRRLGAEDCQRAQG